MVSVLFGLSMDYQVFLVGRMYEERLETGDNGRAVRVGLAGTSRVINSTAGIMISAFLAFILRTLPVAALMHLLGVADWWLPRALDRPAAPDQHRTA
jgi:RND superfamily putative drug exporter